MSARPNVVWIVLDTARADAFEPYGAVAGSSPAIADLARRGTAERDVRSTASWTLPSHLSMFAGQLPRALGLADQAGVNPLSARPIVEAQSERWLPELLRRAGYQTAGVSANAWVTGQSGFGTGFDTFADVRSGRQAKMSAGGRRDRARWLAEAVRARVDDGARDAEREIERWSAARDPDRPFLWFVNLVECHSPYLPPRPYAELSAPARLTAAREASTYLTLEAFWRICVTGCVPPAEALERMRAGYRGAIRYMDAWIERLLGRLDEAGILDDTLVVVTSDHGENFGEGQLIGHGFSLDERLINIPFVAAGPGADTLAGIRSLGELPRRLAEITGLSGHPYDAVDLPPLPVAQFDPPAPPRGDQRTEDTIALWELDDAAAARLVTTMIAAVDGTLKLVVRDGREELYDLVADPLELTPLGDAAVDAAALQRLRDALAHPAATASHAMLGAAPGPPAGESADDLEERMKLLGYL